MDEDGELRLLEALDSIQSSSECDGCAENVRLEDLKPCDHNTDDAIDFSPVVRMNQRSVKELLKRCIEPMRPVRQSQTLYM